MVVNAQSHLSAMYYTMLIQEGDGLIQSQLKVWDKFDQLNPDKQEVITSPMMAQKIFELQRNFGIANDQIAQVSLLIRKFFFGEMSEIDLQESIKKVAGDKAEGAISFIQKEIFTIKPKPKVVIEEKKITGKTARLSLLKALAEYPRLNDQLITTEKIKLKGQPEGVRPNLGNWIRYYRAELGIGFHNQVERGRFLFQSENGKRLTNEERERINLVIKSIEEDFPIDIDTEGGVIVFPARPQGTRPAAAPVAKPLFPPRSAAPPDRPLKPFQPSVPTVPPRAEEAPIPPSKPSFLSSAFRPAKNVAGETLHFSTGHVLPGEKAASEPTPPAAPPTMAAPAQPFRPAGIRENRTTTLPRSPYSIRPLRLRNEREADEQ